MRVLLVDDAKSMRVVQKNILSTLGITDILEAENGNEALAILAEQMPVDYILMDWHMPEKDGYETLCEIRANNQYRSIKVIMCSSESDSVSILDALKAGANNYITKPFDEHTLREKMGI